MAPLITWRSPIGLHSHRRRLPPPTSKLDKSPNSPIIPELIPALLSSSTFIHCDLQYPNPISTIRKESHLHHFSFHTEDFALAGMRRDTFLALILSAISFAFPAPGSSAENDLRGSLRAYEDHTNKFRIFVPEGWSVGTGGTNSIKSVTAFYPEEVAVSNSNVSIAITGLGPDFTTLGSFGKVDAFAETLVGGLDRSWQRPPGVAAKLVSSSSANGLYYIEYTLESPGERRRHIYSAIGMASNGWYNRLYTVTGQFMEDEREKYQSVVEKVVYYVLNPSLVANNLSQTFTLERVASTWLMPVNIVLTFVVGSAFGWILNKITKDPPHLRPVLLGCCASGNLGTMLLIVIPGTCSEKGNPFGETAICHAEAMAYASLSMGIFDLVFWLYVYNIVRISLGVREAKVIGDGIDDNKASAPEPMEELGTKSFHEAKDSAMYTMGGGDTCEKSHVTIFLEHQPPPYKTKLRTAMIAVKKLLTPSTYGVIIGITIGIISPFRKALIGENAPLRIVQGAVMMMGEGAVPLTTLIMGGNLLKGFRQTDMKVKYIFGVTVVRYLFLPLVGVAIVKGAIHFHILTNSDALFQFVLLVQYALPPAMNMGVISELLGTGQSHCSIIFFWTYAFTLILFPLWSAVFMWLI